MSDIRELIERLREMASGSYENNETRAAFGEAADALERVLKLAEECDDAYYAELIRRALEGE